MKRFVSWKDTISYLQYVKKIVAANDREAINDLIKFHGLAKTEELFELAKEKTKVSALEAEPKTFEKKETKKAWYDEE